MPFTQSPHSLSAGWLPESLETPDGVPELLFALFEGNPDMVFVADGQQRIVAANSVALAGFGYLREEIEGQPIGMLLPERARSRHAGHVRAFLANPSVRAMGSGMALKALSGRGEEFSVDVMLWPLATPAGQFVVAVCRKPDAALARSQAQMHALFESVRDYSINLLDPQGRILTWNEGSRRIHGMSAAEALGQNIAIFFRPEDVARGEPQRLLEEAARSGHSHATGWGNGAGGAAIWADVDFTAIRDSAGHLTGFTRVLHDTTANRKAQEALRDANRALAESEERFRLLVEPVTDYAIYMLDPEGRVKTWNEGAERNKGYTREEVLGQSFAIFFLPEDAAAGLPAAELALAARDGRYEAEAWRVRKNGERFWALVTLTAIRGGDGVLRGFAKVTRDLTESKRLKDSLSNRAAGLEVRVADRTRQLEATVAELRRKNEEVEAFVYIVSHDLRAPLVNVQGFARELEQSCAALRAILATCPLAEHSRDAVGEILDDEIAGALKFISASSSKFERLIDSLLGLSRQGRQVYRMVQVDVRELVEATVSTLRHLLVEAGAAVQVGNLPPAAADLTALGQVFANLIDNSIKYRSPGRPLLVEVAGEMDGPWAHYWVRDNGLGIPESGKIRLFQVFQRLHPKHAPGEGMGLAIAHRIVERHGGKIWAEGREGEGSTFHFSLPAGPCPEADAAGERNTDVEA
jgi:PAS domain S-box-containing protein